MLINPCTKNATEILNLVWTSLVAIHIRMCREKERETRIICLLPAPRKKNFKRENYKFRLRQDSEERRGCRICHIVLQTYAVFIYKFLGLKFATPFPLIRCWESVQLNLSIFQWSLQRPPRFLWAKFFTSKLSCEITNISKITFFKHTKSTT
jgi:hypothetical protein